MTFAIKLAFLLLSAAAICTAQPAHSVSLNWGWTQGTSGSITGFNIKRATVTGGPYTGIGTVVSTTTTYNDDITTNIVAYLLG